MRVLITGITGFVGSHLAKLLACSGVDVFGLAHDAGQRPGVFQADITQKAAVQDVIAACDPEVVVHLAALASVGQSWKEPELYR
jgi:GDP-6-deoxy-D-talose 4-dehydrogenase